MCLVLFSFEVTDARKITFRDRKMNCWVSIWLARRLNESNSFSVFSIKKSKDLIGWFLLWREKKLSRNLGDVKADKIWFEIFEGLLVNWMLGTKIIWIKYDVRVNAKQSYLLSSSNFQSLTFEYPDHEEFFSLTLTEIFLFWFRERVKSQLFWTILLQT